MFKRCSSIKSKGSNCTACRATQTDKSWFQGNRTAKHHAVFPRSPWSAFFQIDEMKRTDGEERKPHGAYCTFIPLSISRSRCVCVCKNGPDYSRGIPRLYTSKALSFEIPFCRYWQPISTMMRAHVCEHSPLFSLALIPAREIGSKED